MPGVSQSRKDLDSGSSEYTSPENFYEIHRLILADITKFQHLGKDLTSEINKLGTDIYDPIVIPSLEPYKLIDCDVSSIIDALKKHLEDSGERMGYFYKWYYGKTYYFKREPNIKSIIKFYERPYKFPYYLSKSGLIIPEAELPEAELISEELRAEPISEELRAKTNSEELRAKPISEELRAEPIRLEEKE